VAVSLVISGELWIVWGLDDRLISSSGRKWAIAFYRLLFRGIDGFEFFGNLD
jgi:hypothetical protein